MVSPYLVPEGLIARPGFQAAEGAAAVEKPRKNARAKRMDPQNRDEGQFMNLTS